MTSSAGDDPHGQLVRPFLDLKRPLQPPPMELAEDGADRGVRAYAMTRGRAHASRPLEFETMLQTTAAGREAVTALQFERAGIMRCCQAETLSVAELAARMRIAIGVVRVVAADLVSEGMLESFEPSENVADDVLLIARLIAGVRAL